MGLKNAKSEVCKAIHDRLNGFVTYSSVAVPVYVDIAPKNIGNDTYILIWGYIDSQSSHKLRFGWDVSLNVEIRTNSDNSVKHNAVINSVKGLIHTKKVEHLNMTSFSNPVLLEPSTQVLEELTENGQIFRTLLRYELIVEQK